MIELNDNALCTEYEVKNYNPKIAEGDLDRIKSLINSVSSMFESYCGRKFVSSTYTEYYNGSGTRFLYLDNYPVTEVSSIYDDSGWDWNADSLIDSTEYRIMDDSCIVCQSIFSNEVQNIKITYTAGYTTIPEDLKQVCIEETVKAFGRKDRIDQLLVNKDDGSSTYFFDNLLPKTKMVLDHYRIVLV